MQFDARVAGAREAPAAEHARLQLDRVVAPVLLRHDVARQLARAEERVRAAVDLEGLGDAVLVARVVVIPARLEFLHLDEVRRVAVDLVRAHLDEHRLGRVPARPLEHVHRARRVGVEVLVGHLGREVVAGLRRRVDDQFRVHALDQALDALAVADVQFMVGEPLALALEPVAVPRGVALVPEEGLAHVAVHAVDIEAHVVKEGDGFGADQAAGSGDENTHGGTSLLRTYAAQRRNDALATGASGDPRGRFIGHPSGSIHPRRGPESARPTPSPLSRRRPTKPDRRRSPRTPHRRPGSPGGYPQGHVSVR